MLLDRVRVLLLIRQGLLHLQVLFAVAFIVVIDVTDVGKIWTAPFGTL